MINAATDLKTVTTQLQHGHAMRLSGTVDQETSTTPDGITVEDIDRLFVAMVSLYGNRWTSAQGEYDVNGVWFAELRYFTADQIRRGLKRCRENIRSLARANDTAWPPQAAEFAIMCEPRPEDHGLPSEDNAWTEANAHAHEPDRHRWSHPAVLMAGRAINGGFAAIHSTTALSVRVRMERHFKNQYKALVNRVLAGEELVARGLIESDANKHPAELSERFNEEKAMRQREQFSRYTSNDAAIAVIRRLGIGSRAV